MSHPADPLDAFEQALDRLTTQLAADGYEPGYPTWQVDLQLSQTIEIEIASSADCPKCGNREREHAGFVRSDGSPVWRGFSICSACAWVEEFTT
jgi:hypothetical protein